jgi:HSP20 family protein
MSEKKGEIEKIPRDKRIREEISAYPLDVAKEIDRLLSSFPLWPPIERRWPWPDAPGWPMTLWPWLVRTPKTTLPEIRAPFCDLVDAGKEYKLRAEMPGISKDKINITVDKNSIEISAEAATDTDEHEAKGYVSRERAYSKLYRSMEFPEEVIPERAEANYENGMLEVKLPKKTPTEITKHKVKVK